MRLESVRDLKQQLINDVILPATAGGTGAPPERARAETRAVFGIGARPFDTIPSVHRSVALGVSRREREYRLAIRVQRPMLMSAPLVEHLVRTARGEADVRLIGRIDKRARRASVRAAAAVPWYREDTRPMLIGASVGHVRVTAGTIGAFVTRGERVFLLSNNHVLANEDRARQADWILQRAKYDGGREPRERVARLRYWVRLKARGVNVVDCALAEIQSDVAYDPALLRGIAGGRDGLLAGTGGDFLDEGETVYKIGRTTGVTEGRVTAFDVDNVVVNYDVGNLRFDNQIEIEGAGSRAFSDGGDSGSLIVDREMRAVALLFAGGETGGSNGLGLTFAHPIGAVLSALKATLLS
jgi:S1-C subfamily serine protease